MKLRATLNVNFDVQNYREAGEMEQRLIELLKPVFDAFPQEDVDFSVAARRDYSPRKGAPKKSARGKKEAEPAN